MPKSVGYLIPIAFEIAIILGIGSQNGCDFTGNTWFFGNTDLHFLLLILKLQSSNFEIGIERKSSGVMNGKASGGFSGAEQFVFSRTNPPAVRCISSLRYEDAASIRAKDLVLFT